MDEFDTDQHLQALRALRLAGLHEEAFQRSAGLESLVGRHGNRLLFFFAAAGHHTVW